MHTHLIVAIRAYGWKTEKALIYDRKNWEFLFRLIISMHIGKESTWWLKEMYAYLFDNFVGKTWADPIELLSKIKSTLI